MTEVIPAYGVQTVVYDALGVNPYGRELAFSLACAEGRASLLLTTSFASWSPPGVVVKSVIPHSSTPWRTLLMRLLAPLRAVLSARRSPAVLVVAWTRDVWDNLVFTVASCARLVVVIAVDHNPTAERRRGGATGACERLLMRSASLVVVHNSTIEKEAQQWSSRVEVAPHPPYASWADAHRKDLTADLNGPPMRRLLFVGATRRDKGFSDAIAFVGEEGVECELVIAGRITDEAAHAIEGLSNVHVLNKDGFVPDDQLATELGRTWAVLAPYSDITASGSLTLCSGLGVRIISRSDINDGLKCSLIQNPAPISSGSIDALLIQSKRVGARWSELVNLARVRA